MSANIKKGHKCYTCNLENHGYCMLKRVQLTTRERNCKYYEYGYYDKHDNERLNKLRKQYSRENDPFSL